VAATVETRATRIAMRAATYLVLLFIFLPLGVIVIYAFNPSIAQTWPPPGFTTRWFSVAFHDAAVRSALLVSVEAGLLATAVALVLGSLAAFAVHRFRFFGRETVSFLLILPIALPGVVTGIALNSAFDTVGATFGLFTIVIGHATFCVVVVYNNVIGPTPSHSRLAGGGLHGPRSRRVADVSIRDMAEPFDGPGGRRVARVRPLVRRAHRDELHCRLARDPCPYGCSTTSCGRGPDRWSLSLPSSSWWRRSSLSILPSG
jgi:hypothetical protein